MAKKAPVEVAPELGASGLRHSNGWLREERLPELQGRRGREKFREMSERNAIVGACLGYTASLIKAMTWSVAPFSGQGGADQDDQNRAAFVWDAFNDMSHTWTDFLDEALSMITFGFSPHEVVLKRRLGWTRDGETRSKFNDGLVGLRKLPLRGQETVDRWDLDANGGIQGLFQTTERGQFYIPIDYLLLIRTSLRKNNPEGRSLLRTAYEAYYFSTKLAELEALGFERDAAGIPVMTVPAACFGANATADQKATLLAAEQIVKNIKIDQEMGIVLPSAFDQVANQPLYKLELLTSGGQRAFDAGAMIQRWDQRMAMAMLSDFVLMGHEKLGSYALSHDKTTLYGLALEALASSIAEPINAYLIPKLCMVNGWPGERTPRLCFEPVEDVNLAGLADYLQKLGIEIWPELEDRLMQLAELPTRPREGVPSTSAPRRRAVLRRPAPPSSGGARPAGDPEGDRG